MFVLIRTLIQDTLPLRDERKLLSSKILAKQSLKRNKKRIKEERERKGEGSETEWKERKLINSLEGCCLFKWNKQKEMT